MDIKYYCEIFKKIFELYLVNCWLRGKKDFYISFRVYFIVDYVEFLNVDVLVCLCIIFMFFVNESFGM